MATSQPPPRAQVPERLGRYPLQGIIGAGALGVVYKAHDAQHDRPVAIRALRHDLTDGADRAGFLARLQHEAQAAGRLAHPGVVAVYEYGAQEPQPYLALEYVDGGSLRQYLERRRRFDAGDSISLLAQALEALEYVHGQGVWHCDLKPANILIDRRGRVKLTDFGIARVEAAAADPAGAMLGTPGFIAPEVYLGARYDRRVDLFALGVVAYQLFAEAMPFPGPSENIMYKVCHQTPVAPSVAAQDPALRPYDGPVLRALAKRPQERYASADEFRGALVQAHGAAPAPLLSGGALDGRLPEIALLRQGQAAGPGTRPASAARLDMPGWDGERLGRIDQHLTRFIGPLSRVMVKRAASQTRDETELVQWLAANALSPLHRAEFLRLAGGATESSGRPTRPMVAEPAEAAAAPAPPPPPTWSHALAADAARATRLLTTHLGPIAQVMVKRASAEPELTREKFLRGLALLLANDKDRAAFLAEFGLRE